MLLFLVTPCLAVAVQACMEWIPIKIYYIYNITCKYDTICVSETYLNQSDDSSNLSVPDYDIIRVDHPSDQNRGGVCLYFNENLILRRLDVSCIAQCLL